ncbi:MAG TPA: SUMF1/EgtB/PvdO family nonheme iron enzyme, partial [Verrucomicrobiota bacterium]|nr:SUMF1/EgtB/PvdO family nonheme iron enzyme [Verrucomicrobiota bacterium]
MKARIVMSSLVFIAIGEIAADLPFVQSEIVFDGLDRIQVSWAAEPGEVYFLQSTPSLTEPWQDVQTDPPILTATTNLLAYELMVTNQTQFLRVGWRDTHGPRLIPIYPRLGGIAVPRDSAIETRLCDPSGVDSSSIQFSLADQAPIGLDDSRLTYTNEVLSYRPPAGETLGDYGRELSATVVVSDQAGNRSTNLWPFRLELQTILSTNILVVGGPGIRGPGPANPGGLTLVSRNGLVLVYRYEGASSGLRQGMHLVDSTPGQEYALTVTLFSEEPLTRTVSVWTQRAALADLIEEGSISTRSAILNRPESVQPHIGWKTGMDLHFEHTIPLATTLCESSEGENSMRAELTDVSELRLHAEAGFAANFRNFRLTEFEVYAGGSATLNLELHAEGNCEKECEGHVDSIAPIYEHYVIPVAGIPIEVTTQFEVELPYALDFQAQGHFRTGIQTTQVVDMGRKWDGAWHDTTRYPPLDFDWSPVDWQVSGTIAARVDVKPKMTVLVYGLMGPYAGLNLYAECEGWAEGNPAQFLWGLYGGLDAHLGCGLTVFDRLFPNLSFEQTYEILPQTRIASGGNVARPPRIVMNPHDRTVTVGEPAGFAVFTADGTPPVWFQWQWNGVDLVDDGRISGAQSSVLRIANARLSDAGEYRVMVGNAAGRVTSTQAPLTVTGGPEPPEGMVLIPAKTFQMGDSFGEADSDERPVHSVTVSAFFMDQHEVSKGLWDQVYAWAIANGYEFDNPGSWLGGTDISKDATHPVFLVNWFDAVKWCNARSEREGRAPAYYIDTAKTTVYRTGVVRVENDWVEW